MDIRKFLSNIIRVWKKPVSRVFTSILILSILLILLPLRDLWEAVRQISFSLWIFTVIAFIAGHMIGVFKWSILINLRNTILPFTAALRFYFAGLFANLCLPSIVGGDIIKSGLAIRFNNEKESVIFGSLLDRVLDTLALCIIIIFGAFFSSRFFLPEDKNILGISLLLLLLAFVFMIFILFLPLPEKTPGKMKRTAKKIQEIGLHLLRNPFKAFMSLSLAVVIQTGFVVLNMILGKASGIDLPFHVWCFVWPLAKLAAMLPVSMGGLGIRELALASLLERFGIPFVNSVALSLVWETILIAGGLSGGAIYILSRRNTSMREGLLEIKNFTIVKN
jgi:uncharacterized protein (TIRG00374 family)